MNKEAIDLLIQTNPRLRGQRAVFETMQPGAYCIHRSWGLGEILRYDEKENRLVIQFEGQPEPRPMDPAFCAGRLDILDEKSILVRHKREPDAINELIKNKPADLITEILSHMPDSAATGPELERQIHRLMGEAEGKKWWTKTRRLLIKDPRVAVPARKSDPYLLRDEPVRAEEEVLEEFFETRLPKKKIAHAEKLLALSVSHDDIKEALPDILKELTASLADVKTLNEGERLHGIWVRNDLARFINDDPEQLEPTSSSIILEHRDLPGLSKAIPAAYQKRYLSLLERVFPDDYVRITLEVLRESEGKLTNECINFLLDRKHKDVIAETLMRWRQDMSLRGPVMIWILKNRHSRKHTKMLAPLIGPQLLSATLFAVENDALQNTSNRRIPLAEMLSDDPDLITELLSDADPQTAQDLGTTLMLNQGFDTLSKKSLIARFIRLFPHIQQLVEGDAGTTSKEEDQLIVSQKSFDERQQEYELLISKKIPENKIAIAVAREHGDLRENADYKMARQEQDTLLARKSQLERDLNRARITDFTDAPTDVVGIGSVVEVTAASTGETIEYSILAAWDSNPEANILSYQTPLAQSLIGKRPGEVVSVEIDSHKESWQLKAISRWVDRQPAAKGN